MSDPITTPTTDQLARALFEAGLTNNPMPGGWDGAHESFRDRARLDATRVQGYIDRDWPLEDAIAVVYVERSSPMPKSWDEESWRESGRKFAGRVLAKLPEVDA